MLEEQALVVARCGEDQVWVETERQTSCGGCAARGACGTGVLAQVLGRRSSRVRALDPIGVEAGERVVIGLQDGALVRGSMAVYAVPLLALIGAAVFGEYLASRLLIANPEPFSVAAGLAGLVAGLLWVRRFTARICDDRRYQPVILRRVQTAAWSAPLAGQS